MEWFSTLNSQVAALRSTSATSAIALTQLSQAPIFKKAVRREPISKTCEITQADNLYRRQRLSRKAQ